MDKEKLREIVKREFDVKPLGSRSEYTLNDLQESLVEALHQALSMSGVVVSPCDHSDTYPLNQKYSMCRKCGGCVED